MTGLLPIFALPLLGIMGGTAVANTYFGDSVIICWSSLVMSEAVEKYGLHKRFAYNVIRLTYHNSTSTSTQLGISSDEYLILSFVVVTGFISMWLSNSATAVLMVPLSKAVIQGLKTSSNPEPVFTIELKMERRK